MHLYSRIVVRIVVNIHSHYCRNCQTVDRSPRMQKGIFRALMERHHGGLRRAENLRPFCFRSLLNKSVKSIANYRNRSKSIITKTRVVNFYRLRSITFDFYRVSEISIRCALIIRPSRVAPIIT